MVDQTRAVVAFTASIFIVLQVLVSCGVQTSFVPDVAQLQSVDQQPATVIEGITALPHHQLNPDAANHTPNAGGMLVPQVHAGNLTAGSRKLLINLRNQERPGMRKDRKHKKDKKAFRGCPIHIVVLWPKMKNDVARQVIQELYEGTPGLRILRFTKLSFPEDQKEWAMCLAKFYSRNQLPELKGTVKPQLMDPNFVIGQKGFGKVRALAVTINCHQSRWRDAPGTEGTTQAAMGSLKKSLRKKYNIDYTLHCSDDEREAHCDIPSFFGENAYEELVNFRDAGGKWDGTTAERGPEGCPIPGEMPRAYTQEEKDRAEARKAKQGEKAKKKAEKGRK
mmetsp:Transcript_29245/g.35535  ORF Transcript_29245/g.35535 Transcript_29245/m.35535 type:complete len:336 (+) Transcript_29245:377-1384(+)|eukprot:CAMPEP_0197859932 /NCGR_PEP_ID=MMETSP1438-20131217/34940_1 /TAXON_ID=1461541 /ORGANISM="Pterosperma sp., Strain CCMP1384" /LENGTH=335 /DNA_ID=CAMNT_0043476615 /DNA_START=93 /DNA_END=1100 /DNA_ORIENTATION=+